MIYRPEAGSDIKQETIGDQGMIDHFFPLFLTFYWRDLASNLLVLLICLKKI